jgi:hypothetical protein
MSIARGSKTKIRSGVFSRSRRLMGGRAQFELIEPRLAVAGAITLVADGLLLSYPTLPALADDQHKTGLFSNLAQTKSIQGTAGQSSTATDPFAWMRGTPQRQPYTGGAVADGEAAAQSSAGGGGQSAPNAAPVGTASTNNGKGVSALDEDATGLLDEELAQSAGASLMLLGSVTQLLAPIDGSVWLDVVSASDAPETAPGDEAGSKPPAAGATPPAMSAGPAPVSAPQVAQAPTTPALSATYGVNGIHSLVYNGQELINSTTPAFASHMVMFQWWEQRAGETAPTNKFAHDVQRPAATYDAATQTITRPYPFGTLSAKFTTLNDRIMMKVTVKNTTSNVTITGWNAYMGLLDLPTNPQIDGPLIANSNQRPVIVRADYTDAAITVTNEAIDKTKTVYGGYRLLIDDGTNRDKRHVFVGTTDWQYYTWLPSDTSRPLAPGASDSLDIALRFGPGGPSTGGTDLGSFQDTYPRTAYWPDRRIIGTLFPASTEASPWPTNPNGYLGDPNLNVFTTAGLNELRTRLVNIVQSSIDRMRSKNAQGLILWNIDGNKYNMDPWRLGYVGSPELISMLAPELAYAPDGEKTVDKIFRMIRESGLRSGLTVRPEVLVPSALGGYELELLPTDDEVVANLINKIRYAQDRWGCTMFYIDVLYGKQINVMQRLQEALPDVLLIPEHEVDRTYAYGAGYQAPEIDEWATPASARQLYPSAFSVLSAFNVTVDATARAKLLSAANAGDVLMTHAWWNNPSNGAVVDIYEDANPAGFAGAATVAEGRTYTVFPYVMKYAIGQVQKVEVNWGDGSPTQTVTGLPNKIDHVYTGGKATRQVNMKFFFTDGTSYTAAPVTMSVNQAAAVINPISNITATSGQLVNFSSFLFSDPDSTGLYSVKVFWGDGTFDTVDYIDQGSGVFATLPTYKTFRGNTVQTVTVEVTDSSGAVGRRSFNVDVRAPNRGNGTGLLGTYRNVGSSSTVTRTDSAVNFRFSDSPITGVAADRFAVTWTGKLQAQYNETYTFTTHADDGLVLWIDGVKLIDRWMFHGVEQSATITLAAGQQYDIRIDYHDVAHDGFVKVWWASPSTPRELLPTSQLFPATQAPSSPPGINTQLPPVYVAGGSIPGGPPADIVVGSSGMDTLQPPQLPDPGNGQSPR